MAEIVVRTNGHVMNANDTYILRWPHNNLALSRPYTLICHIEDASDDGSYSVHARPQGSAAAFEPIVYQSLHLNNAAGTGALVSTAITDDSLIAIEADGLEIALIRAGGTTGASTLTMSVSQMA